MSNCITFRFAFITDQIIYMEINIWIELMELRMGLSILLWITFYLQLRQAFLTKPEIAMPAVYVKPRDQ